MIGTCGDRPNRVLLAGLALGAALLALVGRVQLCGCAESRATGTILAPPSHPAIDAPLIPGRDRAVADQAGQWVYASVSYRGEAHDVNVYLPTGYPGDAPYPAVYLLHGWGMDPGMWYRDDVQTEADSAAFVLVAVEGDDGDIAPSWYSRETDLPVPAGSDWTVSFYDWFFDGVLPWVEANYEVRAGPAGRAIVGFSMGGKGALSLAGHRPDLFAAAVGIAGVMDLRDYSAQYEVPDVYGPLAGNGITYAADSPIDLAANLAGVSVALLHGDSDTWVDHEQSRRMSKALGELGYPHYWEEIPGQDHEPVTTYQITVTFRHLTAALAAYSPPSAWRYRFADDLTREVYGTELAKTDPLTWTEVIGVIPSGFEAASGDAFVITTAPVYSPGASYVVSMADLMGEASTSTTVVADQLGHLSLEVRAGHYRVSIRPQAVAERTYLPLVVRRVYRLASTGSARQCVKGILYFTY